MTHRAYEIEKNPQTEPCPNTLLLNGKKGRSLATGSLYDNFSNLLPLPMDINIKSLKIITIWPINDLRE